MMGGVAGCGQFVEGGRKLAEIAGCDCALHSGACTGHERLDHVADRNILIARDEVLHVGKYFLQLAQLVSGELPVSGLPGEPELGVIGLNSSHEFTKARKIVFRKLLGRRRRWRGLLRGIRQGLASGRATHGRDQAENENDSKPFHWELSCFPWPRRKQENRKSTRLNSSHPSISYAVFC